MGFSDQSLRENAPETEEEKLLKQQQAQLKAGNRRIQMQRLQSLKRMGGDTTAGSLLSNVLGTRTNRSNQAGPSEGSLLGGQRSQIGGL